MDMRGLALTAVFIAAAIPTGTAFAEETDLNAAPGGLLIIEWARESRLKLSTDAIESKISADCKKFSTPVNYGSCESDPALKQRDLQRKMDRLRPELRRQASVNPEIRTLQDREDALLKDSVDRWFHTCDATAATRKINMRKDAAQGYGCDALGNAVNLNQAGIAEYRKSMTFKQAVRELVLKKVQDAQKKDWNVVHGVSTRAYQKAGYGKNLEKEVQAVYGDDGAFSELLDIMDNELCKNADYVSYLAEKTGELIDKRVNCTSMKPQPR
jgi:hypothetical protein